MNKHIDLKITSPIELNFKGDVKQLLILVGQNASGKSLVNKIIWTMELFKLIKKNHFGSDGNGMIYNMPLEQIFEDIENLSFHIETFDYAEVISETHLFSQETELLQNEVNKCFFNVEKGKVTDAFIDLTNPELVSKPFYLSTKIRTFDNIKTCIKLVKNIGSEEVMKNYGFKLYDLLYIEYLKEKLKNEATVENDRLPKNAFSAFDGMKNITGLKYIETEEDANFYYSADNQEYKPITSLSSGEQSLICMLAINIIN